MPATFTAISRQEMVNFLSAQGYEEVTVPRVKEMVMEKPAGAAVVRVYTSIVNGSSRGVGRDAIRVVVLLRRGDRDHALTKDRRVHRVENWQANLQDRLDRAEAYRVRYSPQGHPMVLRRARNGRGSGGYFLGSLGFPEERFTMNLPES